MKNKLYCKMLFSSLVFSTQILMFTGTAQASIFKCVNAEGATFYNDKPCPKNEEETELDAVKDPINGYIPPKFVEDKKEVPEAKGVLIGKSEGRDLKATEKEKSEKSNASSSSSTAAGVNSSTSGGSESSSKQKSNNSSGKQTSENVDNSSDSKSQLNLTDIKVVDVEPHR